MNGTERLVLSGSVVNQTFFDKVFELAGSEAPRVVVDLSAAPDQQSYLEKRAMYDPYLRRACGRQPTFLQDETGRQKPNRAIGRLLRNADVLFVGGGSTRQLWQRWTPYTKQAVRQQVQDGELIGSGTGAGALLWFQSGHSDSRQYEVDAGQSWRYIMLPGLGLIDAWATVHQHDHDSMGRLRQTAFHDRLKRTDGWQQAIGISSNAALVCADGLASVLEIKPPKRFDPPADITLYRPDLPPVSLQDGEVIPLTS